jgi:Rrf2 family protein
MYMVRHATDLPVTTETIARSEGIPASYLAKLCRSLVEAGFIRSVTGSQKGYEFARPPEEISLLDLFEAVEGHSLFDDCLLRNCECGGTPGNCHIYSVWVNSTRKIKKLLAETSVEASAWNHPEHRFDVLPEVGADEKGVVKSRRGQIRAV